MAAGFDRFSNEEQATMLLAAADAPVGPNVAAVPMTKIDLLRRFVKSGEYIDSIGWMCLSWEIGHPILIITVNHELGKHYATIHGYDEDWGAKDAYVIPLWFNGVTGPGGHYKRVSDAWLKDQVEEMGLPWMVRPTGAEYCHAKFSIEAASDYKSDAWPRLGKLGSSAAQGGERKDSMAIGLKKFIAADGEKAVVKDPVVPVSNKYDPERVAPGHLKRKRSTGEHLKPCRFWYVEEGAPDENGDRRRNVTLSNDTAEEYWKSTAMMMVAKIDAVTQDREHYSKFFEDYLTEPNLKTWYHGIASDKNSNSKATLATQKPRMNSLLGCFIKPDMDAEAWRRFDDRWQNICREGSRIAENLRVPGKRGDIWVPDETHPAKG